MARRNSYDNEKNWKRKQKSTELVSKNSVSVQI